jgi:hypothetical protein
MARFLTAPLMVVVGLALSGCLAPNPGVGPNGELPVIARPYDQGIDTVPLSQERNPAVAYDPDGCQAWLMDDGVEGYIGRRRDAVTGLPICNNLYAPGSVVRDYQTGDAGIGDYIPTQSGGVYGAPVGVLAH